MYLSKLNQYILIRNLDKLSKSELKIVIKSQKHKDFFDELDKLPTPFSRSRSRYVNLHYIVKAYKYDTSTRENITLFIKEFLIDKDQEISPSRLNFNGKDIELGLRNQSKWLAANEAFNKEITVLFTKEQIKLFVDSIV